MGRPKKVVEPEPEEIEVALTGDVALAQAAQVLVTAAEKAELMNDTDALMKIAGGWMEIHEYLAGGPSHPHQKAPLGFAGATHETEEEEELDDAIAAESKSSRGVHAQYGKLRVPASGYRRGGFRPSR